MKLTITIPAHNEEHRIGRMLDAYLPFFTEAYGDQVEILVVINGSTDGTEQVVQEYEKQYSCLRHITEPRPVGKGGALMIAFEKEQGDLVGFADADGSTPPSAFKDLVDNMGDADCIIASRWCHGAEVFPRQPLLRQIASRTFNLITRVLLGLPLTDTQCGAKLMRREAIQKVLPHIGITQWAFDVDMLYQLKRAGCTIREIPTVWKDVDGSKVQIGRTSSQMLLALGRLRLIHSPLHFIVTIYDLTLGRIVDRKHLNALR
jgi:glycosyltransferase involved in cell wall biosynthesis